MDPRFSGHVDENGGMVLQEGFCGRVEENGCILLDEDSDDML